MALWRSSFSQRGTREAQKQFTQWIGDVSSRVRTSPGDTAVYTLSGQSAMPGSFLHRGTRRWRVHDIAVSSFANVPQASSSSSTASSFAAGLLSSVTPLRLSSQRRLLSSRTCGVPTSGRTLLTRPTATVSSSSASAPFSTRPHHFHRTAASTVPLFHARRTLGQAAFDAPKSISSPALSRSASQVASAALATGQVVALDAAAGTGTYGRSLLQQLRGHLRSYYELSKTRLSLLVVATAGAGFVMGSGEHVDWALFARTCAGTFLAAASANSFNQAWEVHSDAAMKRTCKRPLPSGRISRPHALLWATAAGASGVLLLLPSLQTPSPSSEVASSVTPSSEDNSNSSSRLATLLPAALAASNIGLYALVYTPLKQIHPINTWVGALVGAIPPLIGWSAASGQLLLQWPAASAAWLWASVLLLWQMPHFHALSWLCREDYKRGGYKMLSVVDPTGRRAGASALVNCLLLLPLPAVSSSLGVTSPEFAVGATAVSVAFASAALPFYRSPSPAAAKTLFRLSLLHLPAYMAAMTAFRVPHGTPHSALATQPLAQAQAEEPGQGVLLPATTEQEWQQQRNQERQQDLKQESHQCQGVVQPGSALADRGAEEGRMVRGGGRLLLGPPLRERAPPVAYASAAPFPFLPLPA